MAFRGAELVRGVDFEEQANGCWLWLKSTKNGYAQWRSGRYVHRDVSEAVYGAFRPGELTRHTCDTRACVRPSHFRRGGKRENFNDFLERGDLTEYRRSHSQCKLYCKRGHRRTSKTVRANGACKECARG